MVPIRAAKVADLRSALTKSAVGGTWRGLPSHLIGWLRGGEPRETRFLLAEGSSGSLGTRRRNGRDPVRAPLVLPATFSSPFAPAATLWFRRGPTHRPGHNKSERFPRTALPCYASPRCQVMGKVTSCDVTHNLAVWPLCAPDWHSRP